MARFTVNRAFAAQMERDAKVQRVLEDRAQDALTAARQIAALHRDTGAYEASLYVQGRTLYTNDFAGHIIEFGSVTSRPLGVLRKAAEQVGGRVVDRG